jgi:hypothetical protein
VEGSVHVYEERPIGFTISPELRAAGLLPVDTTDPNFDSTQPIEVDYAVFNWRWIRDVVTAELKPDDNTIVELDLLFDGLDPEANIYLIELDGNNNPQSITELQPSDMAAADIATVDLAAAPITPPPSFTDPNIERYDLGKIWFVAPSDGGNVPVGSRWAVVYRTLDEWALQLRKAFETYTPFTGSPPPADVERHREFVERNWVVANTDLSAASLDRLGQDRNGDGVDDGRQYYLGFMQSSAGVTVMVDYKYDDDGDGIPDGTIRGEIQSVSTELDSPVPSVYNHPTATPPVEFPYQLRLNRPYFEILSVRGASVAARAAWNQDGLFRHVWLESYL